MCERVLILVFLLALAHAETSDCDLISNSCLNTTSSLTCSGLEKDECPPALFCEDGHCQCAVNYPNDFIICNGTASFVEKYYCVTFDRDKNIISFASCPLPLKKSVITGGFPGDTLYNQLPRNVHQLADMMCNSTNRTGALCGRCLPDHYPLAYSYSFTCVRCPNAHWKLVKYIMAAYLPLTLFYIIIVFFKINVTSSHLFAVVYYCQTLTAPYIVRGMFSALVNNTSSKYYFVAKMFVSFYGIWNLDFFRPFYSDLCLGIGILPTLALDYVIAVYPLLLMVISYLLIVLYDRNCRVITIMWRPFQALFSLFKRNWDIRTSVVDAFATFFFLSNIKFLNISFDLLYPTRVYQLYADHFNSTIGLYYSGDIEYFGREHLPYAILALLVLCVFNILPIAVLFAYPFKFFQKFLNLFPVRWYILHTFVDSFQGCYKDGTQPGTRDYRWFASVHLVVRLSLFLVFALVDKLLSLTMCTMILVLHTTLIATFQPFKAHYNLLNIVFHLFLTVFSIAATGVNFALLSAPRLVSFFAIFGIIVFTIPFLYALIITSYSIYTRRKFGLNVILRLRLLRKGYSQVPELESIPDRIENSCKYHQKKHADFS